MEQWTLSYVQFKSRLISLSKKDFFFCMNVTMDLTLYYKNKR